ncbi:hypothetical protein B9Z19DRAFT_595645 [Tuber borchii]|uniref:Uncharacterized protein n=1 Tax=Tuber borchii TaxID=42251 RepID=A0A2T7A1Q0_TUBBO|nr:hypothetical protein B9Z19DRAFT_595645 [Tuber borchii]
MAAKGLVVVLYKALSLSPGLRLYFAATTAAYTLHHHQISLAACTACRHYKYPQILPTKDHSHNSKTKNVKTTKFHHSKIKLSTSTHSLPSHSYPPSPSSPPLLTSLPTRPNQLSYKEVVLHNVDQTIHSYPSHPSTQQTKKISQKKTHKAKEYKRKSKECGNQVNRVVS